MHVHTYIGREKERETERKRERDWQLQVNKCCLLCLEVIKKTNHWLRTQHG